MSPLQQTECPQNVQITFSDGTKRGRDVAHRPAPAVGLCSHAGLTASVIALGISRLTKARESGIQKGRLWWEREGGRKESVR